MLERTPGDDDDDQCLFTGIRICFADNVFIEKPLRAMETIFIFLRLRNDRDEGRNHWPGDDNEK